MVGVKGDLVAGHVDVVDGVCESGSFDGGVG